MEKLFAYIEIGVLLAGHLWLLHSLTLTQEEIERELFGD